MKQLALMAALALTGFAAKAQTSETRKSTDFTVLEVKNGIQVIITQNDEPALKVQSDSQNNLDNIVTEYKKGVLKVYMREQSKQAVTFGTAKVFVSAKSVNSFKAVTGSSITIDGKLVVNDLTVKLETGASFNGKVESFETCSVKAESGSMFRGIVRTNNFQAKVTSGSTVKVTGHAELAAIVCNSGSMLAGKFICQEAEVKTINASTAFIYTSKTINAATDTTSSITYYGEPVNVNLGENAYAVKRDNLKLALNN